MLTPAEAEAAIAAASRRSTHGRIRSLPAPAACCARRCTPSAMRRHSTASRWTASRSRAARDRPARFRLAGHQAAGDARPLPARRCRLYRGHDRRGAAARLRHGRPRREGRDRERPRRANRRRLRAGARRHVHRRGSRCAGGRRAARRPAPGSAAPEIAIAASAGRAQLEVSRRPRIAVVSTGDELVEPGEPILDAPGPALECLWPRRGARARRVSRRSPTCSCPTTRRRIEAALAPRSTGTMCWCSPAASRRGASTTCRPCSQRSACAQCFTASRSGPGRPMWFGVGARRARRSSRCPATRCRCWCASRDMSSRRSPAQSGAPARRPPRSAWRGNSPSRRRSPVSCRSRSSYDREGRTWAEPRPTGGSGDFISLAGTDGFVELPPGPATHPAGLAVPFYRW